MSEPYKPPWPVTGIALLYCLDNVGSSTSHDPMGLHGLLTRIAILVCAAFIVCNVSLIVCVALCAVLFQRGVLFCVICVFLCVMCYCSNTTTV
jgi:hypothetical protein